MNKTHKTTLGECAEILSGSVTGFISREKIAQNCFSYAVVVPAQLMPEGLVGEPGVLQRKTPMEESPFLRAGDVLIKRLNPDCAVVLERDMPETVLSVNLFAIRPKPELDSNYLAFLLESTSVLKQISQLFGAGTTVMTINRSQVAAIEIPWIPLEEQREYGNFWRLAKRRAYLLKQLQTENDRLTQAVIQNLNR